MTFAILGLGFTKLWRGMGAQSSSTFSAETLVFAGFQAKKKTSEDVFLRLVGRGNLNWLSKLLIYNINNDFNFSLEYQLEYCTPLDHPFAFHLTRTLRNHDWQ